MRHPGAAAAAAVLVPYKRLVSKAYWFYTANLVLLILVLAVGAEREHSERSRRQWPWSPERTAQADGSQRSATALTH